MPPPRTRFISSIGTEMRWKPSAEMVGRGCGSLVGPQETRAAPFSLPSSTRVSTTLFQVPHSEQRPDHLGKMCPHCSQTKAVLTLAIILYFVPSCPFHHCCSTGSKPLGQPTEDSTPLHVYYTTNERGKQWSDALITFKVIDTVVNGPLSTAIWTIQGLIHLD
jgi:hypothetical protein